MAIAFGANLGDTDGNAGTSGTLTTIASAAAGSRIVVFISYFSGNLVTGVTIGGVAAALDKRQTNGSDKFDIWSLHSAAGLASSSAITASISAFGGGWLIAAASFTGIATTSALVTTGGTNTTAANWSSGAATNTGQADALYVGGAGNEDITNPTTSTATSGTEINDRYRVADQQGIVSGYKIVSTVASDSITGTFSNANSTANTGALAVYAAASAAAAPAPLTFNAIPFMGGVI